MLSKWMKIEGKWSYTDNVHIADSLNLQGGVARAYTSLTSMDLTVSEIFGCQKYPLLRPPVHHVDSNSHL